MLLISVANKHHIFIQDAKELKEGAIDWLKDQQSELIRKKEPYQLAMVAYAMARANTKIPDPNSIALLETLEKVLAGITVCLNLTLSPIQQSCSRRPLD